MNRIPRLFCRQPLVWGKLLSFRGPCRTPPGSADTELRQGLAFCILAPPPEHPLRVMQAPSQCAQDQPALSPTRAGPFAASWSPCQPARAEDCLPLPWQDIASPHRKDSRRQACHLIQSPTVLSWSLPFAWAQFPVWMRGAWTNQPLSSLTAP